ncbi:MAG: F0F1 ATP synthase subunit epsilon [Legionellales bacterium]|nr:F0F1 ATP synthase subunit epsilon [Legionellales bacterium]
MAFTIKVDIVSAESTVYSGQAIGVFLMGELGELGIYPGHSQLLTRLKPGYIRLQFENNNEAVFYISGGFVEIQPDIVTVLADTAERAQDIDQMAAVEAREQAERLLQDKQGEIDYATVLAELAQATAQIQAIARLKKKLR